MLTNPVVSGCWKEGTLTLVTGTGASLPVAGYGAGNWERGVDCSLKIGARCAAETGM